MFASDNDKQFNRIDHGRGTYTQLILVYAMIGTIDFNNLFDGMRIGVVVGILLVIFVLWGCYCGWRNGRRNKNSKDGQ